MLSDVTRAEADEITGQSYICEPLEWTFHQATNVWEMRAGVLDLALQNVSLQVVLETSYRPKTGLQKIRMTLFRVQKFPQRVYQLELPGVTVLQCKHQMPHEHIGRDRIDGDSSWQLWSFDQALSRFMQQTNVVFDPELGNPFELNLFK